MLKASCGQQFQQAAGRVIGPCLLTATSGRPFTDARIPPKRRNTAFQLGTRCSAGKAKGHSSRVSRWRQDPFAEDCKRQQHDVDKEWQALRLRHSAENAPSTSGRDFGAAASEASMGYGFGLNDSIVDEYTPFPSSPPTGLDAWSVSTNPSSAMSSNSELWGRVLQVFVILFGVRDTETEGIYSLRAMTGLDGLPQDTIVAFEDEEDAERYSGLLEATMDYVPSVCPIEPRELLDFCADSGYHCRLEPRGSLLIPPDYNVGVTDWERSIHLRNGHYSVLETDPDGGDAPHFASPIVKPGGWGVGPMLPAELEIVRANLERLLRDD